MLPPPVIFTSGLGDWIIPAGPALSTPKLFLGSSASQHLNQLGGSFATANLEASAGYTVLINQQQF
jgi:hypothetical protein